MGFRPLGHGPGVVILHCALASQHCLKLGAAVADELTVHIPDRRGSGNKQALLAALNLCAWTALHPHTTCTTTDVELLLAHLKGHDNGLDTAATSSDDERALVVSSEPLLAVTATFARTPDRPCSPAVLRWCQPGW